MTERDSSDLTKGRWYADALDAKVCGKYLACCRQDLIGAYYGLLGCATGLPLPDYYTGHHIMQMLSIIIGIVLIAALALFVLLRLHRRRRDRRIAQAAPRTLETLELLSCMADSSTADMDGFRFMCRNSRKQSRFDY